MSLHFQITLCFFVRLAGLKPSGAFWGEIGVGNDGCGKEVLKIQTKDCGVLPPFGDFLPWTQQQWGWGVGAKTRKAGQSQGWQCTGPRRQTGEGSGDLTVLVAEGVWSDSPQHPDWRKADCGGPGELCQHLGELFLEWLSEFSGERGGRNYTFGLGRLASAFERGWHLCCILNE